MEDERLLIGEEPMEVNRSGFSQTVSNLIFGFALMDLRWKDLNESMKSLIMDLIHRVLEHVSTLENLHNLLYAMYEINMQSDSLLRDLNVSLFDKFLALADESLQRSHRTADESARSTQSFTTSFDMTKQAKFIPVSLRYFEVIGLDGLISGPPRRVSERVFNSTNRAQLVHDLVYHIRHDISSVGLTMLWKSISSLTLNRKKDSLDINKRSFDRYRIYDSIVLFMSEISIHHVDDLEPKALSSILVYISEYQSIRNNPKLANDRFVNQMKQLLLKRAEDTFLHASFVRSASNPLTPLDFIFLLRGYSILQAENYQTTKIWSSEKLPISLKMAILQLLIRVFPLVTVAGFVSILQSLATLGMVFPRTPEVTLTRQESNDLEYQQLLRRLMISIEKGLTHILHLNGRPYEYSTIIYHLSQLKYYSGRYHYFDNDLWKSLWLKITDIPFTWTSIKSISSTIFKHENLFYNTIQSSVMKSNNTSTMFATRMFRSEESLEDLKTSSIDNRQDREELQGENLPNSQLNEGLRVENDLLQMVTAVVEDLSINEEKPCNTGTTIDDRYNYDMDGIESNDDYIDFDRFYSEETKRIDPSTYNPLINQLIDDDESVESRPSNIHSVYFQGSFSTTNQTEEFDQDPLLTSLSNKSTNLPRLLQNSTDFKDSLEKIMNLINSSEYQYLNGFAMIHILSKTNTCFTDLSTENQFNVIYSLILQLLSLLNQSSLAERVSIMSSSSSSIQASALSSSNSSIIKSSGAMVSAMPSLSIEAVQSIDSPSSVQAIQPIDSSSTSQTSIPISKQSSIESSEYLSNMNISMFTRNQNKVNQLIHLLIKCKSIQFPSKKSMYLSPLFYQSLIKYTHQLIISLLHDQINDQSNELSLSDRLESSPIVSRLIVHLMRRLIDMDIFYADWSEPTQLVYLYYSLLHFLPPSSSLTKEDRRIRSNQLRELWKDFRVQIVDLQSYCKDVDEDEDMYIRRDVVHHMRRQVKDFIDSRIIA